MYWGMKLDAITDVTQDRHERGLYMFTDNPGFGGSPLFRFVNMSSTGRAINGGANCLNALTRLCDGARRASLGNCYVCAGQNQAALLQDGCAQSDFDSFCTGA